MVLMEKTNSEHPTYKIPMDISLLNETVKIDKDYFSKKLDHLYEKEYDTDTALRLGAVMYETGALISNVPYPNLITVFGIFSQIAKTCYDLDVTFNDFFRLQKIVHEQSEKIQKAEKTPTNGKSYIK